MIRWKQITRSYFFLFALSVFLPQSVSANSNWVLALKQNDVSVFTRGKDNSDYLEVKAEMTFQANAKDIQNVVIDASNLPKWLFELREARVIKQLSDSSRHTYMISHFPWPFSDRHFVVENKYGWVADESYYEYTFDTIDYPLTGEGMKSIHGFVHIKPLSSNTSHIVYQFHADPGGVLPSWLTNLFLIDGPYNSLLSLKKLITQPSQ